MFIKVFTLKHSIRLFGESGTCFICSQLIAPYMLVMRAAGNTFHMECFGCQICGERFCVGDSLHFVGLRIVCAYDFQTLTELEVNPDLSSESLTMSKMY